MSDWRGGTSAPEERGADPLEPATAQLAEGHIEARYRHFEAELADRPAVVWGLGWREFTRLLKTWWMILLLLGSWFFTVLIPVLIIMETAAFNPFLEYSARSQIEFYGYMMPFLMIFAALVGARLVTRDLADRAIHLYLARPLTRADYATGRLITLALVFLLVAVIPNLLNFLFQNMALGQEPIWYLEHLWVVGGILLHGAFYLAFFSLLALFFSTMSNKGYWTVTGIFVTIMLSEVVSNIVYFIMRQEKENDAAFFLSIRHNLENLGYAIYRLDGPFDPSQFPWVGSLAILLTIMGGCLAAVLYRLSTLEVSR